MCTKIINFNTFNDDNYQTVAGKIKFEIIMEIKGLFGYRLFC